MKRSAICAGGTWNKPEEDPEKDRWEARNKYRPDDLEKLIEKRGWLNLWS